MKMTRWIFLMGMFFAVSVQARTLTSGTLTQDVPVYANTSLPQSFVVLGKVIVQSPQQSQLLLELKKRVKKYGGDAVVGYQILEKGAYPVAKEPLNNGVATSLILPMAEGVIIKFDKTGKKKIDDSTVIPVLE